MCFLSLNLISKLVIIKNDNNTGVIMKLNRKRTFLIGFAFFATLMAWQIYNTYCPTMLTELLVYLYHGDPEDYQYIVGVLMALDNIFAIVILPLVGIISDKTNTPIGKRLPYITIGILGTVFVFPLIAICYIYHSLVGVIISMLFVIIFMNVFRSPAVALMPDVTLKKHRTEANGIINFVGYIGAILAGGIAIFFSLKDNSPSSVDLIKDSPLLTVVPFIITGIFMILSLILLLLRLNENKAVSEIRGELLKEQEEEEKPSSTIVSKQTNFLRFGLLITAIFFWFAAFNSVETFWGNYNVYFLGTSTSAASLSTMILAVVSLLAFLPAAKLSNKIGRKLTIFIGLCLLIVALMTLIFLSPSHISSASLPLWVHLCFIIAGIGWAMVNCVSYPMLVDMVDVSKNGKMTGWYYTSSMAAQSLTPVVIGSLFFFLNGWEILFYYAAGLMLISLIIFTFIKDTKEK